MASIQPYHQNAGILGLAHEIRRTSSADLFEQVELLCNLPADPPPIFKMIAHARLDLVIGELNRRRTNRRAA
jgi:hypothetical protein